MQESYDDIPEKHKRVFQAVERRMNIMVGLDGEGNDGG
jgi:hypothetical protein